MGERMVMVAIDRSIEATGFSPAEDRLVEMALVELERNRPTGRHWHHWFNPGRPVSETALRVHGLDDAFLQSKPPFVDLVPAIIAFIDGAPLVAHQAGFDMELLNAELARAGCSQRLGAIDMEAMAERRTHLGQLSLDALCRHYHVPVVGRREKGALLDALLSAEVWRNLLADRPLDEDEGVAVECRDGVAAGSPFRGTQEVINRLLGDGARIDQRTTWLQVARWKPALDFPRLIEELFRHMEANWARCLANSRRARSSENWRWCKPQTNLGDNGSAEVTLERHFIRAVETQGDWANQVPVASGLGGPDADRRRAIDLVCRRGPGAFDFIELKFATPPKRPKDSPLFAAMEIIGYGMAWLLSRRDRSTLAPESELLTARDVRLSVLGPQDYYEGFDVTWLAKGLDGAMRALGRRHDVMIEFAFECLPPAFAWSPTAPLSEEELRAAFNGRRLAGT